MADEKIRILFKVDGEELHSEVLTESLGAWLDNGWELAPDFLSEEDLVDLDRADDKYSYEDWVKAGGKTPVADAPEADDADETPVADFDENDVETPEEN